MIIAMDAICKVGAKYNEDAIGYGKNYIFVIDGASGLTGINIMGKSDAAWFSRGLRDGLSKAFNSGDCRSTIEIIQEIIHKLAYKYRLKATEVLKAIPKDSPSAGIALFREWPNGCIEMYALGDCIAVVQDATGNISWSCDTLLPALDAHVISQMVQLHNSTGISVIEAKSACNDMLIYNRSLRNTPNGYWILDLSGIGIAHARTHLWRQGEINALSVFSDGFAQLSKPFDIYKNYGELHIKLLNTQAKELLKVLYSAQRKDANGNRFPRFKFRDDASTVIAKVV